VPSRDQEAPEAEAEFADRLAVARPLALSPHAAAGDGDVGSGAPIQGAVSVIKPRSRELVAAMALREDGAHRVPQRDLQVTERLPEPGAHGGVPCIEPKRGVEVPAAPSHVRAQALRTQKLQKTSVGKLGGLRQRHGLIAF
jgi:hypothetical protein